MRVSLKSLGVFLYIIGLLAVFIKPSFGTNATAGAKVVTPLQVYSGGTMNFGKFAATNQNGYITSYGSRGDYENVNPVGDTANNGGIYATGELDAAVSFSADSTVTLTSGASSMVAELEFSLVSSVSGGSDRLLNAQGDNFILQRSDNVGFAGISVAGILRVNANQPIGTYVGSYIVNIAYN